MRVRRLRKHAAHLEITAFINLIVVLVPFLLSTAVFTRLAVIDLALPAQTTGAPEQLNGDLKLEILVLPDSLQVGDRIGGRSASIPNTVTGYDVAALSTEIQRIKTLHPDKLDATVLAQPDTPYDTLVQVMDAVRAGRTADGTKVVRSELFPNISIGDAPVRTR